MSHPSDGADGFSRLTGVTGVEVRLKVARHVSCSQAQTHLSAREDVSGQFDLGEVALPDGFQQPVVADVGLLRLLGAAGSHAGPGRARADLLTSIAVRRVLRGRHVSLGRRVTHHQRFERKTRGRCWNSVICTIIL